MQRSCERGTDTSRKARRGRTFSGSSVITNDQLALELRRLARDKREVIVAYPTLSEAYTLVLYRLGKDVASNWMNDVLSGAALLNPTPEDYREAIKKLSAFADQPITLFDATVAVLSDRLGVEVWTYDRHFDLMRAAVWR